MFAAVANVSAPLVPSVNLMTQNRMDFSPYLGPNLGPDFGPNPGPAEPRESAEPRERDSDHQPPFGILSQPPGAWQVPPTWVPPQDKQEQTLFVDLWRR